jgi:hypothetical protein
MTWGLCQDVVVRHREYLLTVVVGIALALLMPSLLSANAEGATTDKTISGTAYDLTSTPLAGAHVTVAIWGGYWPDQAFFRTSQSAVTDAWGYYEVTISGNYWDPHNTIKVKVTYDSLQGTRDVEANGDEFQTVDVFANVPIPEFSSPLGLWAMMAGCIAPVVVLLARRRR